MSWTWKRDKRGDVIRLVDSDDKIVLRTNETAGDDYGLSTSSWIEVEDESVLPLIAAAPALLEACQSILDELEDRYDGATDSKTLWMGEHIDQIKAAIRMAGVVQ